MTAEWTKRYCINKGIGWLANSLLNLRKANSAAHLVEEVKKIKSTVATKAVTSIERVKATISDLHPSTPVGRRKGFKLKVPPGTNKPTIINGRVYSGHAVDRLQERGLLPLTIENTIKTGNVSPGNVAKRLVHRDSINNITVVTENEKVITVIAGGAK